jgi:drug/metabolite transporter (DMT)-like permease
MFLIHRRVAETAEKDKQDSENSASQQPESFVVKMKKPMFLFYFSITLAIASSALYHFSAKSTPVNVNFSISLVVTYLAALGIVLLTTLFFPSNNGLAFELKQLNWASFLLAIAIVGIEFGFLLVYRSGWNLGITAVLVNVVASLILVPVAIFVFKDRLNWVNILGVLVCLAGLLMLNWKR